MSLSLFLLLFRLLLLCFDLFPVLLLYLLVFLLFFFFFYFHFSNSVFKSIFLLLSPSFLTVYLSSMKPVVHVSFIHLFSLFTHLLFMPLCSPIFPSFLTTLRSWKVAEMAKGDVNGRWQGKTSQCLIAVASHRISSHAAVVGGEEDPRKSHLGLPETRTVQKELGSTSMMI